MRTSIHYFKKDGLLRTIVFDDNNNIIDEEAIPSIGGFTVEGNKDEYIEGISISEDFVNIHTVGRYECYVYAKGKRNRFLAMCRRKEK